MIPSLYSYPFYPLISLLIYSCNIALYFFNGWLYCLYIYILILAFIYVFVYVYFIPCYIVSLLFSILSF